MMNTTEFIALCDGVLAEVQSTTPQRNAYEEERVMIKDAITPAKDEGMLFSEFKRLRTGFIYLSIIDDTKDYSPYYYILEKVSENFNGSTHKIADWSSDVWKGVIAYAKSLPEYPRTNAFTNELFRVREREVAKAAKRLVAYGAKVTVEDCELVIRDIEGIYTRIELLFYEIGGENALRFLLSEIPFVKEISRYLVPHQVNTPMLNMVELEKPYGYLFNLCLKHLKNKGTQTRQKKNWDELVSLTTDLFVAVYDSQKFDIWSDIIYKPDEVVKKVHEMIQRLNLYTLPQTHASFALDWCRFLCKWMKRDGRCDILLKGKLESIERVMNWAVSVSKNNICIHIKKGSKDSRLLERNKVGIENQILINAEELNANFMKPEDLNKVNSVRFPIIETDTEYVLLPKPLVIWNWYEAIFNIIKPCKVLAKDIGFVMEDFVRNKLSTHGITSHTGEYEYNGIAGEVDFLLEATHADAYIESKKKSLSLQAKAGDDYYIWGDLYEFIQSQTQCARLENGVKKYGPIAITEKNSGAAYAYGWKDKYTGVDKETGKPEEKRRYIVKTTMTLKEYGPLQDKVVLTNIIKNLLGRKINASFDATDTIHTAADQKNIQDVFEGMNQELLNLTNYYQATGDDNPTFFCRFYSMEQIYFLIREAKNQDHFVKLLDGGFVTTGTENFWNEYLNTIQFIS